jgi:hypothetical protein
LRFPEYFLRKLKRERGKKLKGDWSEREGVEKCSIVKILTFEQVMSAALITPSPLPPPVMVWETSGKCF